MLNIESFLSRAGLAMRESAIRKMGTVLAGARDMVSFAPGYPAEALFPWDEFRGIADDLLGRRARGLLQYGATRGYRPFLESLTELLSARSITSGPDRLTVTNGSQQGLDLVSRVLLDPGDAVLVELPSYTGAIAAFRASGAELVGVRQDPDGLNLEALDAALRQARSAGRRVKALYVVPNFQNPTGVLVGADKRRAIVEWAERRDVLVIEDDPYRDIYFAGVDPARETRPIAADDAGGRVIYISSTSKTLAPGLRVGWVHASPALTARFEMVKQAADLCTGGLVQMLAHEAITRGVLERQLPRLRAHYEAQRTVMEHALHEAFGDGLQWTTPRGGFFLWARLGEGGDGDALLRYAQERGVIYVAGSAFFVAGDERRYLRLSFSAPSADEIREGVRRLADAVTAYSGAREVTG